MTMDLFGETVTDAPPSQPMHNLTDEEFAALKADIERRGEVIVPVVLDDQGGIIDGQHRVRAWQELTAEGKSIKPYMRDIRIGLTPEQREDLAIALNLYRRQLTVERRQELVTHLQSRGWSLRRIATTAGVSHEQVRQDGAGSGVNHLTPASARVTGKDGKSYPARQAPKPKPTPIHVYARDEAEQTKAQAAIAKGTQAALDGLSRSSAKQQDALFLSKSPEWNTPAEVLVLVDTALGGIDLDPCADDGHKVPAVLHLTVTDDGLAHEWHGRIYMNPPYGDAIPDWSRKFREEYVAGRMTEGIALVPARTDTDWWQDFRDAAICFVHHRLKFSNHDNSAPFPSAVAYLGSNRERFTEVFRELGDVWTRTAD